MNNNNNQDIIIFKTDNGKISMNVKLDQETVWLTLNQLCQLFERDKSVISRHLKNIFKEGELEQHTTIAKFATVPREGSHQVQRTRWLVRYCSKYLCITHVS
ncbi:MAG: hypothetical protein BGO68_05270 [Candidatus Amoebophilus sp. 36-38]|nr:MAG: hypothetical protein BGO68_05270 [Candidatus Amoebophilus sp. 36-38]